MSYPAQAADLLALLDRLGLEQVAIVGHSMGARWACSWRSSRQRALPAGGGRYRAGRLPHARHQNVFAGLNATLEQAPHSRSEAEAILAQHIEIPGVRQFLLKSFAKTGHGWGWRFNVPALERNYANIMGWPDAQSRFEGPALFIRGDSDYMQPEHTETVTIPPPPRPGSSLAPVTGCTRKSRFCSTNWLWISCRQAVNSFKSFVI